jgi:outer membrane receptor for ferrienterochelin and colicin
MLQSDREKQERDYNNRYVNTMRGTLENRETFFNSVLKYRNWKFLANYTYTNQESAFYTPPVANGSNNPRHTVKLGVQYEKQLNNQLTAQARLYYTDYRLYSDMEMIYPGYVAIDDVSTKQFHAEANVFWQPLDKWKIAAGLSYEYLSHYSAETDSPLGGFFHTTDGLPEDKPQSLDIFAQATYHVQDNLKLIAGLRLHQTSSYQARRVNAFGLPNQTIVYGEYQEDNVRVIPRLAGLYRLNEHHLVKLLYGESIADIATQQNTNLFDKTLPALTLENINTTELVYVGSFEKIGITASLFRNQLDNLIVRTNVIDQSAVGSDRYMMIMNNSGKMRTYGAELTLQLRPTKAWQIELSGTYQKTRDKKLDMDAAYSPKFLGYGKVAYQVNSDQTVALLGRYVSSMMPGYDESTQRRIGNTVDGYTLLDVNYRWNNVFTKGVFVDLRVSNLLDEEIRYPAFTNNSWATLGTVGEDRTFFVTVGMKF